MSDKQLLTMLEAICLLTMPGSHAERNEHTLKAIAKLVEVLKSAIPEPEPAPVELPF